MRNAFSIIFASLVFFSPAFAQDVQIPVIAPLTGPIALEGTSQRNGAVLAIESAASLKIGTNVLDTAGAAEGGANALERVAGAKGVVAAVAPMFGTQVLPMIPLADEYEIPLLTTAGTAAITEKGSKFVFRFFPSDLVAKRAHARYVLEDLGKKRIAILYNSTAYGQSGYETLSSYIKQGGGDVVYSDGIELTIKDMMPTFAKMRAANPDVVLIQMHTASMALLLRQYRQAGFNLPVVANTMLTMPSTAALLDPAELKGLCAETSAWIGKGLSPELDKFIDDYTAKYKAAPDFFALQQYDGVNMAIAALKAGAQTSADVQAFLATEEYAGAAMTYKSDGKGNMAHSSVIVCFDGTSRTPVMIKSYAGKPDGL
ncbi:ABC transporter substrate-binding protein [Terrihabitans sp. B22-R8]|uniref:ABC transporter substrate-binding protein n=1 Tax=Terrihabitans sp. B22-R8 TaxID=3425128 RepID=UPI00403CC767